MHGRSSLAASAAALTRYERNAGESVQSSRPARSGKSVEYHRGVPDLFVILVILLVVVVVVRGPKTLPQIGAMLGRGVKEARREANELRQKVDDEDSADRPA